MPYKLQTALWTIYQGRIEKKVLGAAKLGNIYSDFGKHRIIHRGRGKMVYISEHAVTSSFCIIRSLEGWQYHCCIFQK